MLDFNRCCTSILVGDDHPWLVLSIHSQQETSGVPVRVVQHAWLHGTWTIGPWTHVNAVATCTCT